jgi:hypothetical protein
MSVIGKVSAVFTANSSGLVSGVNKAASSMRRMEGATASLRSGMNALVAIQGAQLFGSIASTASNYVRSLVSMGAAQAEVIDQQSKLAARVGMTYGEFSGLALAGDLAGVGMDTIAKAATKADIAFVKAQQGSKTAQAAFATLGLSMDELAGMSAADRFKAISAAIAALPTEAQRAAAATALFGKAGAELLPLFAGGAEGIAEAAAQAERLGLALTTAQGQDVEAMNDAFTLASKSIAGVVQQVVAYLAPAIKNVADTFTNLVGSIGGANIGQAIGNGILQGARFLAGIGDYIITNFSSVFSFFSDVGAQWGAVADFMHRAANFMSGVFNAAQAGLGMIVLGFTGAFEGLATIAQQIGQFLGFDTSTLDAVVAGAQAFNQEISNGITENINAAQAGFAAAFAENTEPVGQAVAGPLTTALDSAISQAQASAAQVEESGKGAAAAMAEQIAVAVEPPAALKGVDSRSSDGVAEMFRLMRGTGADVQERQLGVLEHIADTLDSQESDYPFAIDGA